MRIPLTSYARREIILYGGLGLLITALWLLLARDWWYLALLPAIITVWVFSFFRDPHRRVPQGSNLIISPADGTITAIERVPTPPELLEADSASGQSAAPGAECLRISIFLSVFNCHLNRAPCAGRVLRTVYKVGRKVNALRADSATVNEQNILIMQADAIQRPLLVRQISGAIARRIVCQVSQGQSLDAGQRYGMIKFGSRTDLVIPGDVPVQIDLQVGQRVKAGLTIMGRFV